MLPSMICVVVLCLLGSSAAWVAPSETRFSFSLASRLHYRSTYELEESPLITEDYFDPLVSPLTEPPVTNDPAMVEFVPPPSIEKVDVPKTIYPFALMMQGSAPYIAAHAGKVAVFHFPGDVLESPQASKLLSDLALAWLLGMKIVLVVSCRSQSEGQLCGLDKPHECHNSIRRTDQETLRHVEEEAGYLRTEMERKLNKCLRMHGASSHEPGDEGNVVSGNFYSAQAYGSVQGEDFGATGFASKVHTSNIHKVLNNNDVVLLTTVGSTALGDLVNVNGYHLAATVAASLDAYKLLYFSVEGSVLQKKGSDQQIQEIPRSFAKSLTAYHDFKVHNTGFATFDNAKLEDPAVELLLHLGWATWALERGVTRAHIVNPGDGALLEELFTSKNGANTCLYHDEELNAPDDDVPAEDWEDFFAAAQKVSPSQG